MYFSLDFIHVDVDPMSGWKRSVLREQVLLVKFYRDYQRELKFLKNIVISKLGSKRG